MHSTWVPARLVLLGFIAFTQAQSLDDSEELCDHEPKPTALAKLWFLVSQLWSFLEHVLPLAICGELPLTLHP